MQVDWKNIYSVRIPEIDKDHKHFISLLNRAYAILEMRNQEQELKKLLDDIIIHTSEHFKLEEKYFKFFNYEFSDEHIEQHRQLTASSLEFKKRFEKEGVAMMMEFLAFMVTWFVDHLKGHDRKYARIFRKNGWHL